MQLATTVAAGRQKRVSVASQRLCFRCTVQRHDLMSGRNWEANRRPNDGHPRTHARAHTHTTTIQRLSVRSRIPEVRGTSWCSTCSAVTVPCKLTAFFDTTAGFFLRRNVSSKILYKHEINLFSRISVMNNENVLQPKTSCKITLMCMWEAKLGTENWLKNVNKALTV